MSTGSVSRRYARALLAIGKDQLLDDVLAVEMERLAQAYQSSTDLQSLLANPVFGTSQRQSVLEAILTRLGLSTITQNVARLLLSRGRISAVPGIARSLRQLVDEQAGRVRATITSAAPLDKAQEVRIRAALGRAVGRAVVLETREDPALIAGVVTQVGDVIYDGSLAADLVALRQRWKH